MLSMRIAARLDRTRIRFWRPLVMVFVGLAAALATTWIDSAFSLPWDRSVSVNTAQTFQVTVAGTMITATVVVFWIRGLLVTTHTGDFPNRILSGYLHDRYQQWMMGMMVSVFVFATAVLFAVPRPPGDDDPIPDVPVVSIATTAVATVAALLAIIQSVESGARLMHEQRILRHIVDTALAVIDREYPERSNDMVEDVPESDPSAAVIIRSKNMGWLHTVREQQILDALPDGALCHREARIGQFVTPATHLCRVWVPDGDVAAVNEHFDGLESAFELDTTRSPHEDISFGLRNLVDVALGAMSGGTDRTNAREAIAHLEAVMRPLIVRDGPPRAWNDDRGRWMVRSHQPDYVGYVNDAFEDLRALSQDPLTARALLDVIDNLSDAAMDVDKPERASLLRRHADLIVEEVHRSDISEVDERWIRSRADRITTSA